MAHDTDTLRQIDVTSRLLAIAEACGDTRDLEKLLGRFGQGLFGCAQADVVAITVPPSAGNTNQPGPAIYLTSRAPLTPASERDVVTEVRNFLDGEGVLAPPEETFTLFRGTEITPMHSVVRADTVYPMWSRALEFEGETVGILIIFGFQDWLLAPSIVEFLDLAASMLSRAIAHAQTTLELRARINEDGLTGCLNRRGFDDAIHREIERSRRGKRDLSLIMLDVDHFKDVNDRHGHQTGDDVLTRLVSRIGRVLRRSDYLCRFGGDEFAIILPEVGPDLARVVAERIVDACSVVTVGDAAEPITLSIGVATSSLASACSADLVRQADEAMYLAKRGGRARISRAL